MHFSQEITSLRNEIKDEFSVLNHKVAIKRLIDFVRNYCPAKETEAIMISQDFYDIERDLQFNFIEAKEAKNAKKQITLRALITLESAWNEGSNDLLQS